MKKKTMKGLFSALFTLAVLVGMMTAMTFAVLAGHTCSECGEWIDGSPYCSECYACEECIELCLECGKCTGCTGADICTGCSDEDNGSTCTDCAEEKGYHCPECSACYFNTGVWCEECGRCEDCVPYDEKCSNNLGEGILCEECAADKGSHCHGCGGCYFDEGLWCEDCGLCAACVTIDLPCSEHVGEVICEDCATYYGTHCAGCDGCYFAIGSWCEECGQCEECSPACIYCCEEVGEVICTDCAIEQGLHCSNCSDCYGECGGDFCTECGICAACADICLSEELCIDCAIANGLHCPNCESCAEEAPLCSDCGEHCLNCADAFCESCDLCSDCALICLNCGACENCADICPNCEEYCSECEDICDDCGYCVICCADIAFFAGCDCSDWVCVESMDWDEHLKTEHADADGETGHNQRPSPVWTWDDTYHWHMCVYCFEDAHCTGKVKHSFDGTGKCTSCSFVKDAKIQIVVQPKDVKSVCVTSVEETPHEDNYANFSVKAIGNSELSYQWYLGYYHHGYGKMMYSLLKNPQEGERFDGPDLTVLAPEDACCRDWFVHCVITDEEGNEITTTDALFTARHDYRYFKSWKTNERPYEYAERNQYGHVLQCVGDGCEKVSALRPHEDENGDAFCDICDFDIGEILIKKQPKNTRDVYSWGPFEDYDESNIAHFSVEAEGKSELSYAWYLGYYHYGNGKMMYSLLENPREGECFDGPDLAVLAPEDACYRDWYVYCVITDVEGNEARTTEVTLQAKHNYQYYKQYHSHENPYPEARIKYKGHVLQCVGDGCGKVTRLLAHVDENHDYICEICDHQKDIYDAVGIHVTAPKEGQLPSYTVSTDSAAYYAMGGSSNYTQYRFWFVSDNGTDNWKIMDKNTPFVAGKYYKFSVEMQTETGYSFPTYTHSNGTVEFIFFATVNGNYADVTKTYNKEHAHYCTITYNFGMCNDSVIENVVIENVVTPVVGEKPNYTASIRGNGYAIRTDYTRYENDNMPWSIPENERKYYIVNGIAWMDVTNNYNWVYAGESFVPGHEYMVYVYLKTEDGFTFAHNKWYEPLFTASINGYSAKDSTSGSSGLYEQNITATFPCRGKEITTVMINGLETPKIGKNPDYKATAAYPEWYQLDPEYAGTGGIVWYDTDGNMLEPTDTFKAGKKYWVELKIIPAKINGANASQFTKTLTAYVNGKQVDVNAEGNAVYAGTSSVYVYYVFPKEASYDGTLSVFDAIKLSAAIRDGSTVSNPSAWLKYDFDDNGILDSQDIITLIKLIVG